MKKSHRTSRAVFLFCSCCDARSMQATFADLTNAHACAISKVATSQMDTVLRNYSMYQHIKQLNLLKVETWGNQTFGAKYEHCFEGQARYHDMMALLWNFFQLGPRVRLMWPLEKVPSSTSPLKCSFLASWQCVIELSLNEVTDFFPILVTVDCGAGH